MIPGFIFGDLLRRLKEEKRQKGGYSMGFKIAIVLAPILIIGGVMLYAHLIDLGYIK